MFRRCFVFLLAAVVSALGASRLHAEGTLCPDSYYGVCAHIGFNDPLTSQKLEKMREAGIRWVRADFLWGLLEKPEGEWHFESIDAMLDEAEKNGIAVLPILDYSNTWATPAVEHLDAWCNYVQTVVTRYKDRLRYWEVWNEENLKGFWVNDPNGAEYTKLLKASYETIKGIDPELTVVYGGLSGVPMKYFEETLLSGAGDYFDVMNFHPYRGGFFSVHADDQLISDITALNQMMEKYNCPDKPIWITEMGWATLPGAGEGFSVFLKTLTDLLREEKPETVIAYIDDPNYPDSQGGSLISILQSLPENIKRVPIKIDDLAAISPEEYDMLILPPGESFPSPYFDAVCRFVEKGGTLFLSGGVPLFYEAKPNEKGEWERSTNSASETFRQRLRIGWRAYWFDKSVPDYARVVPTDALRQAAEDPEAVDQAFCKAAAGRYLSDSCLQEGDEMIPLASGHHDEEELPGIVLYRYHDWKGKVVVSTVWEWADGNTSNVPDQAVFLAQSMILARCGGVSKYFWYEFQAPEVNPKDKESYFGITHADLSPKPAYTAYCALTAAAPEGSADFCRSESDGKLEIVSWTRPDGKKAWAVWSPGNFRNVSLKAEGAIDEAFDLLGEPAELSVKDGVISQKRTPSILYIIGPDKLTVMP